MDMIIRDVCPRCQSPKYKKNGHIHNGKQNGSALHVMLATRFRVMVDSNR
jgi:hypothetical protein